MKWRFYFMMFLSLSTRATASDTCSDNEAKNELERVLGVSYLFFY